MSLILRLAVGVFLILHGLVYPLLAVIPAPRDDSSQMGEFWTQSLLFGSGPRVKILIYGFSIVAAAVLVVAGVSFMAKADWWRIAWIAGAGFGLLTLVLFWQKDWWIGVLINLALLAVVLFTRFSPGA